jgi:hypothetical protein
MFFMFDPQFADALAHGRIGHENFMEAVGGLCARAHSRLTEADGSDQRAFPQ